MLKGRYLTVTRSSFFSLTKVKWQNAKRFIIIAVKGSPIKITGIKKVRNWFLSIAAKKLLMRSRKDENIPSSYLSITVIATIIGRTSSHNPALDDFLKLSSGIFNSCWCCIFSGSGRSIPLSILSTSSFFIFLSL